MNADITALTEDLLTLGKTVLEADEALQTTIKKVESDLATAKKDLLNAMADDAAQLNSKIETLTSALEAAYMLSDEMIRRDIEGLSQRLDELNAKHQEDIDALRAELDALKAQIAKQDEINNNAIQTLNNVDSTQQEAADINRTIAIVGLGIGSVSMLGSGALLLFLLKKKFLTKV